ncbi:hypothetical protein [Paraburkholderia elongata]|nr:hypothetical protein [Paraburkholderia elongata]
MEQDEFSAFEHRGWEKVAQPYHSNFGDLTTQLRIPVNVTANSGAT